MTFSKTAKVAIGAAAVLLLAFLLYRAQSVSGSQHNRYNANLQTLKQTDATLNQDVLRTRYRLLVSYDPINAELAGMRQSLSELAQAPSYIGTDGRTDISRSIEGFGATLDRKDSLIQ